MRLLFAALLLVLATQTASAQDCSAFADPQQRLECTAGGLEMQLCALQTDDAARAACMARAMWRIPSRPSCAGVADAAEKIACLERSLEALHADMDHLRRQIPAFIEQRLRAALEPRLHMLQPPGLAR
jgi:hypothetical protein